MVQNECENWPMQYGMREDIWNLWDTSLSLLFFTFDGLIKAFFPRTRPLAAFTTENQSSLLRRNNDIASCDVVTS